MLSLELKKIKSLLPPTLRKKLPKEITVVKIREKQSLLLNKIYRHKNKPTNVLSFRYSKDYGEILLCPEVISKEARKLGNSPKYQMTRMIIHGMLHLAGVHHEKSKVTENKVTRLERSILKKLGLL